MLSTVAAMTVVTPAQAADVNATLKPAKMSELSVLTNSGSGQYNWQGKTKASQLDNGDQYSRIFWKDVESQDGRYNTWSIDEGLKKAASTGGQYSFRIMSVCQDCSSDGKILPEYLEKAPGTWTTKEGLKVPDWNSEEFLTEWEELMEYLGDKYDGDPRLGYVDIGGYGNWGEWHSYPYESQYPGPKGQKDISVESSKRMINAVQKNFPSTPVLLNTTGERSSDVNGKDLPGTTTSSAWSNNVWKYALGSSEKIGIRNDCLGGGIEQAHAVQGFQSANSFTNGALADRWKTAPVVTEYCGSTKPGKDVNKNGRIDDYDFQDYNRDGRVEAWESSVAGASFKSANDQILGFHVSQVSSDNFNGNLNEYDSISRSYFQKNAVESGYRYSVNSSKIELNRDGALKITTDWDNTNVTPTYQDWDVEYGIYDKRTGQKIITLDSKADLKKVLPGQENQNSSVVTDQFNIGKVYGGSYELTVKVSDPDNVRKDMELSQVGKKSNGEYSLGTVIIR